MKRPSIRLDKEAIVDYLLRHGEKLLVAVIGLAALGLAWGGLDALRSQSAPAAQSPKALQDSANQTAGHIGQEKVAPDSEKRSGPPLATVIEPWLRPDVAAPPTLALLDRPLFEELPKRGQPDVFPIEELRAVAGLAIVPERQQPGEANPAAPDRGRPRDREPEPARGAGGLFEQPAAAGAGDSQSRVRIAPYVVVTGKIPTARQRAEYRRRFEGVGHPDPKRDSPLWSDWKLERAVVGPGGDRWTEVVFPDLKQPDAAGAMPGAGVDVPAEFLLAEEAVIRSAKTPPYCGLLPVRAKGSWGLSALHPWVSQRIRTKKAQGDQPPGEVRPGPAAPDADAFPGDDKERPGEPAAAPVDVAREEEFALFRFVDLAVEPGKTYRYRVRFEVWNPNYQLAAQHLANANLAVAKKLPSPPSNETSAVTVPESTSILLGLLSKDEMKRLKGGLELLVLAPSKTSGDYALRGIVTEPGGFVNVDAKLNKPGDRRTRGEDIATNRVVVDVRGRQEDRTDQKGNRPPEPFELLCLRPDGGFEFVFAADSETSIAEHATTLPSPDGGPADPKAGQTDPAANLFGRP